MELNKWNIFSLLDSSFMAKVKTVCVFGNVIIVISITIGYAICHVD